MSYTIQHRPPASTVARVILSDEGWDQVRDDTEVSIYQACRMPVFANWVKPPDYLTIYHWATNGILGIRLECWMRQNARFTSMGALNRFIERVRTADFVDRRLKSFTVTPPQQRPPEPVRTQYTLDTLLGYLKKTQGEDGQWTTARITEDEFLRAVQALSIPLHA